MSQQSCLPLPSRKERQKTTQQVQVVVSGQMDIDSDCFQGMSAMEYLAQVHAEAAVLPNINTNTNTKTNTKTNSTRSSSIRNNDVIDGTSASLHHLLSHRTTLPPCPPPISITTTTTTTTSTTQDNNNNNNSNMNRNIMPASQSAWVDAVLSDFSELRLYLQKCALAGIGTNRAIQNLPPIKDRVGWHEYCLGTDESEGNVNGYFQDSSEESDEEYEDDDDDKSEGRDKDCNNGKKAMETTDTTTPDTNINKSTSTSNRQEGHPPTVQLLLQMDQVMTRNVLSHLVYFLTQKWEATASRMLWMYALLANLKKPLHRDDLAMLRQLLMECCSRRWELYKMPTTAATPNFHSKDEKHCNDSKNTTTFGRGKCCIQGLNLIICIVGIYFEQGKRSEIMGPE